MLSIGISEEMINENRLEYTLRDKIECDLREIFRQAEEASGLVITDPNYTRFALGKTSDMPMQFTIAKLDDIDGAITADGIEYDDLSGKEFLEALKVYHEKLSELWAKHYGPRYKFRIVSKKYTLKKLNTEYTRIYAEIEDTEAVCL